MEVPIDEKFNFDKYTHKGSEPSKQSGKGPGTSVSENKEKNRPAPESDTPSTESTDKKGFLDTLADTGKAVQDGWGQSLTTLDPLGLIDENGYGDTGMESKRLISTQHDFEGEREKALKQWEGIDQSLFPPKNSFHKIFGQDICTENAIIKCAMGSVFSKLHVVIPRRAAIGTTIKNRVAFITDFVPGANFDGFGACWNILNPVVLANTLAASAIAGTFVLTPAPCMATMMPTPWIPMQPSVLGNKSLLFLTQPCMCSCWGLGFINIIHCGQGLDCSAPGFSNGNGNIDYHAVLGLAANIVGAGAGALAAGAKAATAMSNAARAAQAAAMATKIAKAAKLAEKASTWADRVSTGLTVGDGVSNVVEGNTAAGATELVTAGAGVLLGKAGNIGKKSVTNQARNAVPNEVRGDFDNIAQIADNPEQIKQIVQNNPEIYGNLSTDEASLNKIVNHGDSAPVPPKASKSTTEKPKSLDEEVDEAFDSITKKPDSSKPTTDKPKTLDEEVDEAFDSITKKPDSSKPTTDKPNTLDEEVDDAFDSITKKPDSSKPATEKPKSLDEEVDEAFYSITKKPDSSKPATDKPKTLDEEVDEAFDSITQKPKSLDEEVDDAFDSITKKPDSGKPATDNPKSLDEEMDETFDATNKKPNNNEVQNPPKQATDADNATTSVNEQHNQGQHTNEANNGHTDTSSNENHIVEEENGDKSGNKLEAFAEGTKPVLTLDSEGYGNAASDYDEKKKKKKEKEDSGDLLLDKQLEKYL